MIVAEKTDETKASRSLVTELAVSGMTCANCARHVTEAIQGVAGVDSASVRLDAGEATVRWRAGADLPAVVAAVKEAGYEARPRDGDARGAGSGRRWRVGGSMWWRVWRRRCR